MLAAVALLAGCASDQTVTNTSSKPPKPEKSDTGYKNRQYAANPAKVKFGEFKYVELKQTELNPQENIEGNRKSVKMIDQRLLAGLQSLWPDLKVIPAGGDFSKSDQRTLQISPRIEHIHVVSTGARVWFGVMAGGFGSGNAC